VSETLPPPQALRRRNRELWVGVLVIAGVAATLLALFTLTDASMFRGRYVVTTMLDDAGGIRKGDPVQMRGVNIGRVQHFRISPAGVEVKLEIEGEYEVPSDSHVELKSGSLLGGMIAEVVPGTSPKLMKRGDNIPGKTVSGVFDSASDLAGKSEKVLDRMQAALSDRTVENIEASSVQAHQLLKELSAVTTEQRKQLAALTASLRKSAESVERATSGPELENAIKRLDGLTQKLDGLTASLDRSGNSIESILGRVERGEGTLGRMLKDDTLYVNAAEAANNLNQAVVELRRLTEDIRKQPKKYLKLSVF
jgi:phospholipid/cholesterol/gamma-HCH transport system substrate-binding protein